MDKPNQTPYKMGNNVTSPVEHATKTFGSFIEQLKIEDMKRVTADSVQKVIDYELSVFLEEFIVNDKTFLEFSDDDKAKCVGAILFTYSSLSFKVENFTVKPPQFIHVILKGFEKNKDPSDLLAGLLASTTRYDGTHFFKWVNDNWVQYEECDIVCGDSSEEFGSNTTVTTLGLTQDCAVKGCAAILEYLTRFKDTLSTFDISESRLALLTSLRQTPSKFNTKTTAIPCHDCVILVNKCASRTYKPTDQFTLRLPFNVNQESSELVEDYFGQLNADNDDLANFIISCGSRVTNTLTVLSGPRTSGKSTLVDLVRALFGPYACSEAEHNAGNVNYDLVRTCLYDNDAPLNDLSLIKDHPCGHIVVVAEKRTTLGSFGGRLVRNLCLTSSIEETDRKENIITKLSTRKQLSHVLGWSLKNYDSSKFGRVGSNMTNTIQRILMSRLLGGTNGIGAKLTTSFPGVADSDLDCDSSDCSDVPELEHSDE